MSRKLLIVTLILGVAIIGPTALGAVQNIKVSGDITAYGIERSDFDFGASPTPDPLPDGISALASIIRLRFDADLTENVSATLRLIADRVWGSAISSTNTDIDLDLAYVTLKEIFNYPVTLIIGRQNVRLGSGLIVGDPNTNQFASADSNLPPTLGDLDMRKAFEGIVGIVDLGALDFLPITLTLGYFKGAEGYLAEADDTNVYAVDAAYNIKDYNTLVEVYYVMKDTQKKVANRDDVNNLGTRIVYTPSDNLTLTGEVAYQWGKQPSVRAVSGHRTDLAFLVGAKYAFLDVAWNPTIGIDYARFSENWDPMFEDITPANIANALFPLTDASCIGFTFTAQPQEDLLLKLRYVNLRLKEKIPAFGNAFTFPFPYAVNSDKKDLGNEVDVSLIYDYTEDVQVGLSLDTYLPGDFFASANDDTAFQALGSLKVTF